MSNQKYIKINYFPTILFNNNLNEHFSIIFPNIIVKKLVQGTLRTFAPPLDAMRVRGRP